MKTEDFDYELPERFIAQQPAIPRDSCKLMVVNRDGSIEHCVFRDIGEYLRAGDLLVVNETRVLPARLLGHKKGTGGAVETLLLDKVADAVDTADEQTWNCLVKPGKRLKPGALVEFEHDGAVVLEGEVIGIDDANGSRSVRFTAPGDTGCLPISRIMSVTRSCTRRSTRAMSAALRLPRPACTSPPSCSTSYATRA